MRIEDAAKHLGVSTRRLRHYESQGLIAPKRGSNGYRQFSPADLKTAAWVRDLIASGFSTRELRNLVTAFDQRPPQPGPNCAAAMQDKMAQIDRLVASLLARKKALSDRLAALERQTRTQPGNHEHESHQDLVATLSAS